MVYHGGMVRWWWLPLCLGVLLTAQGNRPRFEDYPASPLWAGPNAPIKLTSRAERMFRTRLSEASRQPPDFAGHFRFAGWGCGSVCAAGAIIDLTTGIVYQPPMGGRGTGWERWMYCGGVVDGPFVEYRPDSRLVLTRCQGAGDAAKQDLRYFVWEGTHFKPILHVTEDKRHSGFRSKD